MQTLNDLFALASDNPQATIYYAQAGTYGLAFWAMMKGQHAPWHVYLFSCLLHAVLGITHTWHSGH